MSHAMPITDAEIEVYHQNTPPSDTPESIIDGSAINSVSLTSRAGDRNDECSIEIDDTPNHDLRLKDRIVFTAYLGVDGDTGYGVSYGTYYGGEKTEITWTGQVLGRDRSKEDEGVLGVSISVDSTDFVGSILKERKISGGWVDEDIGAIIREICERKASEVDASNVPDFGVTTDLFIQNADAWDTITSLAARCDSILRQEGTALYVEPVNNLSNAFTLDSSDYYFPFDVTVDNDIKNSIRVDGGTARQEEQVQEVQDSWQRITETSRITHRLRARKSEIDSIDLYVRKASDEDLTVRLQSDQDGAPVEIDNDESNIVSSTWSSEDLPDQGWRAFFFDDHTLPDRDPWMIIETSGSTGHDIGIDANSAPTHRSYYPHQLSFEDQDIDSIQEYGLHEDTVERDNLETLIGTQHAVQQELARKAWPPKDVTFTARSERAHSLVPGQVITLDEAEYDAVGDFIVTEISHSFEAGQLDLQTDITATWKKGVLAPQ